MADVPPTPTYPELPPEPRSSWLAQNRQSVILGGIAIGLAVVIGVVALVQRLPRHTSSTTNTNVNQPVSNTSLVTSSTNRTTFRRYEAPQVADRDGDGLTDQEEQQLGTNPNAADSDGDGLTDYDEVKIYHTNPLKKDTDGDGVSDGQEVTNGTNPNGPGQLRDVNQAIQQLNNTNH